MPRPGPDHDRRLLLGGLLSAYVASVIPWAASEPVADTDHGAFLALSAFIAGRSALDAALGKRLYDALLADDPGFPESTRKLLAWIEERRMDPIALQGALDAESSPLSTIPRSLASAWFLGIVGSGEKARCIAFEEALNASIVGDVLKPPTYCYGVYGTWSRKPT